MMTTSHINAVMVFICLVAIFNTGVETKGGKAMHHKGDSGIKRKPPQLSMEMDVHGKSSQDENLKLLMNPKTDNMTAFCQLKAGFEFLIRFRRTNPNITDIYIHSSKRNDPISKTFSKQCSRYDNKYGVSEFYCSLGSLKQQGKLFDENNKCIKYKLWATSNRDGTEIIWQANKPFNLVKHLFGCRPNKLFQFKIDRVQMKSINLSWKMHTLVGKLGPVFKIYLDGQFNHNVTCNGGCATKIMPVDTCGDHRVCIQTTFSRKLFAKIPDNYKPECRLVKRLNCTVSEPPPPLEISKNELMLVVIIIIVLILLAALISLNCWRKKRRRTIFCHHGDTKGSDDGGDDVTPRGYSPEHVYTEIPNKTDDKKEICEKQPLTSISSVDESIISDPGGENFCCVPIERLKISTNTNSSEIKKLIKEPGA